MHDGPQLLFFTFWPICKQSSGRNKQKEKMLAHRRGQDGDTMWLWVEWPGEVDGWVAVVFCTGSRVVAVRKGTVEGIGKQAGDLNVRQSDGCRVSTLKQRDGLWTWKHVVKHLYSRSLQLRFSQGLTSYLLKVQDNSWTRHTNRAFKSINAFLSWVTWLKFILLHKWFQMCFIFRFYSKQHNFWYCNMFSDLYTLPA